MKKRTAYFGAAVLAAGAVSAGAVGLAYPFGDAHAGTAGGASAGGDSVLSSILEEYEPGAEITLNDDASFGVAGTLNAEALAAVESATQLEERDPHSLVCPEPGDGALTCSVLSDEEVVPYLENGGTIYQLRIYPGLTQDSVEAGLFELDPDELVCEPAGAAKTVSCVRAGATTPTMDAEASAFGTYERLTATFRADGSMIGHPAAWNPSVAVQVAPG